MPDDRLAKQLAFIVEIDKIKAIYRQTKLFDGSRRENDAEHSWHLAVMAMVLSEHSNVPIDTARVMKMVLIHDLVEVYAGDIIVYAAQAEERAAREAGAAGRIFGLLPQDQCDEFIGLWREFEARLTPEARFAAAIDRLEPVMQNYYTSADAWRKHGIKAEQILGLNGPRIGGGAKALWEYAKGLVMDDWGSQRALLISPAMWREHFKPLYKEYCHLIHAGGKFAFFHSDGHVRSIIPDLIEIGIDALNAQIFCMDLEDLARDFKGRVTFWGEIDRQYLLPFGSPEEVKDGVRRVRRALDDGRGGVIAQCEWGLNDPYENIAAVFEAWME